MKNKDIYEHPRTGARVALVSFTYVDENGQKVRIENVRVDAPLNGGHRKGIRKLGYKNVQNVWSYRFLTKKEVDQTTVLKGKRAVTAYARESLAKRAPESGQGDALAAAAVSRARYDRAKARDLAKKRGIGAKPGYLTKGAVDAMARSVVRGANR